MQKFKLTSGYVPTGDQPQAIDELTKGIKAGLKNQVLLGVTGSGKSVTYATPVLVKGAKTEFLKIGEYIDRIFKISSEKIESQGDTEIIQTCNLAEEEQALTYSFNPVTKKSSWQTITQLVRHTSPRTLHKITTQCGRMVEVTGDHNFFILRNGALHLVHGSELQTGDYLPIPMILEDSQEPLASISLLSYLNTQEMRFFVSLPRFQEVWEAQRESIASALGYAKTYHVLRSNERVSLASYETLRTVAPALSVGARLGMYQTHYQFPFEQPLTDSLLRLIGYYIAEGHGRKEFFILSSADQEIIDDFSAALNELGLSYHHRPGTYDYQISCRIWSNVLRNLCGSVSQTKHLPDFWPQLSNNQLAQLLSSYFAGDGGVESATVSTTTASEQLASDLMYALLRFGIVARVRRRLINIPNTQNRKLYWTVSISGQKFLTLFANQIGFTLTRKNQTLSAILGKAYNTNVDRIPVDGAWIKRIRQQLHLSQKDLTHATQTSRSLYSLLEQGTRLPSRTTFEHLLAFFKTKSLEIDNQALREDIEEKSTLLNLFWSPIKTMEKIPGEKYVYDFAVANNETFLAGAGGIFVHNTFTVANIIQKLQMPALVISHNKTLAGQLYQEMRDFFPDNAVSYFVSYYDYYQPEAYIPTTDTYIEKEAQINELIDKLRLRSTANILTRPDSIVVASVSCIYNIGSPLEYRKFILELALGEKTDWLSVSRRLVALQYERSEFEFKRGTFRLRGDHMDIYPSYEDVAYRIVLDGNGKVAKFTSFDPFTGNEITSPTNKVRKSLVVYPAKHYMMDPAVFTSAETQIRADLAREHKALLDKGLIVEAQRLLRRTNYDLEMIKEVGYVSGIENYSRYFDGRKIGEAPHSLLDYFTHAYGDNFIVFIDESHMTVPQIRGMYNGDFARKKTLIDFGFRLEAAYDNRPLKFDEFYKIPSHIVYVSATPDEWEIDKAQREVAERKFKEHSGVVEQLIRPTGIVDPKITIRPSTQEIPDLIQEIEKRVAKHEKILVTTLTKKTAEDLTEFLKEKNIRAAYLHSDIETLERSDVLDNLRKNQFDVLIGVNLLREGLDLPEVTLVAILDADKEGFLRSRTSLVQTMGRAARNTDGEVILYADVETKSIKAAVEEIGRRRVLQTAYNKKHGITPKTILKPVRERIAEKDEADEVFSQERAEYSDEALNSIKPASLTPYDKKRILKKLEKEMKKQAEDMHFELAIKIREKIKELKK